MIDLQYHDIRRDRGFFYLLERNNAVDRLYTDQRMREIVFKDPVLMAHNSNLTLPPPAKDITPLDATGLGNSGPRFDDFLGPNFDPEDPVVVPEAETGILLGLGLVLLTIAGRERRA